MDPKILKSVNVTAHIALFLLLILSGGFLWGEFKSASKIGIEEQTAITDVVKPVYMTGETPVGKKLFQENCARCHMVDRKLIGPALMNVKSRWADSTHIYSWVKNSQQFLTTGDKYANGLFNEYKGIMPAFPNLSEADIREILYYVDPQAAY